MEPNPASNTQESHRFGIAKALAFAALVLMVVFIIKAIVMLNPESEPLPSASAGEVVIEEALPGSVPSGFPSEIPVEMKDVVESKRYSYNKYGAALYSVSYKSDATKAEKYTEYLTYMNRAGFELAKDGANKDLGVLYGSKAGDDLSVVISDQGDRALVQVNYLDM